MHIAITLYAMYIGHVKRSGVKSGGQFITQRKKRRYMAKLSRFIQDEMRRRGMSQRQFATYLGVSASTVNQHVAESTREETDPSLKFLRLLSQKTGLPLPRVLALAIPEMEDELRTGSPQDELSDEQLRLLAAYENWDIDTAANLFAERGAALVAEAFRKATPDERGE